MTDRRAIARESLEYACGYEHGAAVGSPIYDAVTEGRHAETIKAAAAWDKADPDRRAAHRPFYSSCGDLANWLLCRLGVRASWLNRAELDHYVIGWNIIALTKAPHSRPSELSHFDCGDLVVVATENPGKTHVFAVLSHDSTDGALVCAEYGQPHGAIHTTRLDRRDGAWWRGSRRCDLWISLDRVIEHERAAGRLASPETVDQWAMRRELPAPRIADTERPAPPDPKTGAAPGAAAVSPPSASAVPVGEPPATTPRTLREGMSGEDVRAVQRLVGATPDGSWGPRTSAAVRVWQAAHGLGADAVWGARSRAAGGVP